MIDSLMEKLRYQPGIGHLLSSSYAEAAQWTRYGASVVQHLTKADNDLAILCERMGNYHQATGNLDQALCYFEERSRLGKELYDAYPDHVEFKNGLAISYAKLGQFYQQKNQQEKARFHFQAAEKLWAELVAAFPAFMEFQENLKEAKEDLANLYARKSAAKIGRE